MGDHPDDEVSVVCMGCGGAIHVTLTSFVQGDDARCLECGTTRDLSTVDVGLPREKLLEQRSPEQHHATRPTPSEFPS